LIIGHFLDNWLKLVSDLCILVRGMQLFHYQVVREPGMFAIFIISWFLSILVIGSKEAWDFWNILIIRGQSLVFL
jgi:hypothetical protein